ncbi:MAG: hypothetical protein JJT75_11645 [Opitutales bacterium]|nr:hypothetical protein [Opitutales bacterium]MCH8540004.1 hypothetical protein [Opitutales bacterium]
MTLRLHHYLAILPVFLLLGAAIAGLSAFLEYQETLENLQEEFALASQFSNLWAAEEKPPETFGNYLLGSSEERLEELSELLWLRAFWFVFSAFLAGLFLCEILVRINRRELAVLNRAADQLLQDQRVELSSRELIKEYADLGTTFSTLSQILQDNSEQTRCRLLQHEKKY